MEYVPVKHLVDGLYPIGADAYRACPKSIAGCIQILLSWVFGGVAFGTTIKGETYPFFTYKLGPILPGCQIKVPIDSVTYSYAGGKFFVIVAPGFFRKPIGTLQPTSTHVVLNEDTYVDSFVSNLATTVADTTALKAYITPLGIIVVQSGTALIKEVEMDDVLQSAIDFTSKYSLVPEEDVKVFFDYHKTRLIGSSTVKAEDELDFKAFLEWKKKQNKDKVSSKTGTTDSDSDDEPPHGKKLRSPPPSRKLGSPKSDDVTVTKNVTFENSATPVQIEELPMGGSEEPSTELESWSAKIAAASAKQNPIITYPKDDDDDDNEEQEDLGAAAAEHVTGIPGRRY